MHYQRTLESVVSVLARRYTAEEETRKLKANVRKDHKSFTSFVSVQGLWQNTGLDILGLRSTFDVDAIGLLRLLLSGM